MSLPSTDALMIGYFFSAATAALTKKLMKPSLTPCSFSKRSWNFLRMSISGAMFTSLNVVRMALVLCDCTRRSAMRARRRDIGTRCSGRSPRLSPLGAATLGSSLGAGAAAGAALGAGAAAGGEARAPRTSPLVTRPSLPVPGTEPVARLLSAISLAAAGMAMSPLLTAGAAAAGAGTTAAAAGAPATALPSVSMRAINCSAVTVAPSA